MTIDWGLVVSIIGVLGAIVGAIYIFNKGMGQ